MIKLNHDTLAFEVPNDKVASIIEDGILKIGVSKNVTYLLPPGTWQIVCTSKEATYMQAAQVVEHYRGGFVNYHTEIKAPAFQTPFQSLNSLLLSRGCDINKNYLILK